MITFVLARKEKTLKYELVFAAMHHSRCHLCYLCERALLWFPRHCIMNVACDRTQGSGGADAVRYHIRFH